MRTDLPAARAEILDADVIQVVRAPRMLEEVGAVTEDEARAWRTAIVRRRGLPRPEQTTDLIRFVVVPPLESA